MQVPVYNAPQVQGQVAPDANLDPHRILRGAGDAFGEELGQRMSGAAGELAHIQDTADRTVATDIFLNQVQKPGQQLLQNATQVQGKDVLNQESGDNYQSDMTSDTTDLVGKVGSDFNGIVTAAQGQAKNGRQAKMIADMANAYGMQIMPQVQAHQNQQLQNYAIGNAKDGISMANQTAATAVANGQFDLAKDSLSQAAHFADTLAGLHGIPRDPNDPSYRALQVDAASPIHSTITQGLVTAGRPQDALAYLRENTASMTPGALSQLGNLAKSASVQQQSQAVVNKLMDQATTTEGVGPVGPDGQQPERSQGNPFAQPPSFYEMSKRLRAENLSPEVYAAALPLLKEMQSAKEEEVKQAQTDFFGTQVKARLDGTPTSTIMNTPTVLAMPDLVQAKLQEKLESIDQERKALANQETVTPEQQAKRGFLFNDLLAKARAGQLTKNDVFTNADGLGRQMTAALVSAVGDMQASTPKVQHYAVDHDLLVSSLRHAGLISLKENDQDRALIGDLHSKIMIRQSATQVPWSQENTQKLIDSEIQPIVVDPSTHWWTSDTKKPAFVAEDQVPQAFIQAAQKRNPGLSRNAISQAYFLAKKQGLLNDDGSYKGANQ